MTWCTTISDLKVAYSKKDPMSAKLQDYLKAISKDIEAIKPDFTKYDEYDDAIVAQIEDGKKISTRFIEGVQLTCSYNDEESLRLIYENFGRLLKLYNIPDDFKESFHEEDFDGNRFLIYEMFVAFIGSLIKYDKWELIGKLLSKDLFVDKKYHGGYYSFEELRQHIRSLDDIRKSRLKLNRISITADIIKEHFSQEPVSRLLNHQEFMEADFFLYLRSICHKKKDKYRWSWYPISCVYLDRVPSFLQKSESAEFFSRILIASGIVDKNIWIEVVKAIKEESLSSFTKMSSLFRTFYSFDPDRIGTRP